MTLPERFDFGAEQSVNMIRPVPEPQPPASPVRLIPTDTSNPPRPGIALCLSGGGYRAMLFHVGALWRLNNAGYLRKLKRISSVSGGSITAAMLGLVWSSLDFDDGGVGRGFQREVGEPIQSMASHTIDKWSILFGLLGPWSV